MKNFEVVEMYTTGSKVETIIVKNNLYSALLYAHSKALKNPHYIESVYVYNEFGYFAGGWSRKNGKLKSVLG